MRANLLHAGDGARELAALTPTLAYFPPWGRVRQAFLETGEAELKAAVRPLLALARFDAEAYAGAYEDLRRAQARGQLADLRSHWLNTGYFEGRVGRRFAPLAPDKT